MTDIIKWSQIEAECGDYRAGFVATFRKYEGQPTDEKDAQGRTVKVTVRSFARHVGIPEGTFHDWVTQRARPTRDHAGAARRFAKGLPAEEKAKLAAELMDDPDVEVAPSTIAKQASRPDVARAIARNDEAREAVEEEAIEHRARHRPDNLPEPRDAGRRAGAGMARRMETDAATLSLRQAAGIIAEAVFEREQFGIEYPDAYAEARARVDKALTILDAGDGMTADVNDDDRAFLESIGVQS